MSDVLGDILLAESNVQLDAACRHNIGHNSNMGDVLTVACFDDVWGALRSRLLERSLSWSNHV